MFLLDIEPAIHAAISTFPWSLPEVRRSCLFMVEDNSRWEAFKYYGDRVLLGVLNELLRDRYSHLPSIFSVTARRIIVCNETLGYMMYSMGYGFPRFITTRKAKGDLFKVLVGLYRRENSRVKTKEWARATFTPILDCAATAYWPPFVPLTEPPPLPRLPPVPQTFSSLPRTSTPPPSPASSPPPTQTSPPAPANTLTMSACSESEQEAQQTAAYQASSTKRKREQTRSPELVGKRRRQLDLSDTSMVAATSRPAPTLDNSAPASVSLPAALGASRAINSAVSQKTPSSSYTVPGASRRTPRGPRFWLEQRARRRQQ